MNNDNTSLGVTVKDTYYEKMLVSIISITLQCFYTLICQHCSHLSIGQYNFLLDSNQIEQSYHVY